MSNAFSVVETGKWAIESIQNLFFGAIESLVIGFTLLVQVCGIGGACVVLFIFACLGICLVRKFGGKVLDICKWAIGKANGGNTITT